MRPKNEENEILKQNLAKYKNEITELKEQLKEKPRPQHQNIDSVDQMLFQHMNKAKCPPALLRKLGQGEYIFGSRRIFAKFQNGKLVIRVGGGYLLVDEFLRIYTSHELAKLEHDKLEESIEADLKNSNFIKPLTIIRNYFRNHRR